MSRTNMASGISDTLLKSLSATLNDSFTPIKTFLPRDTDGNGKSGCPTDTLYFASPLKKVSPMLYCSLLHGNIYGIAIMGVRIIFSLESCASLLTFSFLQLYGNKAKTVIEISIYFYA